MSSTRSPGCGAASASSWARSSPAAWLELVTYASADWLYILRTRSLIPSPPLIPALALVGIFSMVQFSWNTRSVSLEPHLAGFLPVFQCTCRARDLEEDN